MKQILFLFLTFPLITFAQTEECEFLFSLSIEHAENEKLDSAILLWEQIVENCSDTSVYVKNSLSNIPSGYERLENYEAAKKWTKRVLETDLNNLDQGEYIMELYANYHHNACMQMVRILYKEGKFEEGIEYLNFAESKYPYETFNATSFEERAVSIALRKSDFFMEMDQKEKAIWALVNKAIDVDVFYRKPDWVGFLDIGFYSSPIRQALDLIEEIYSFDAFKTSFFEAIKKLKVKKEFIIKGGKKTGAKSASFVLFGQTYFLGSSDKKINRKKFQEQILSTSFVAELNKVQSEKS